MLQVHQLQKHYGASAVLSDVSFIVNDGEHVGLIGPNGTGKSTILRCLIGQETPDTGTIVRSPQQLRIGYLPQSFDSWAGLTVRQVLDNAQASLRQAEQALDEAANALASASDYEQAMQSYETALNHFEALGGYERQHRAAATLTGLGVGDIDPEQAASSLSGGQKTRLGLALLLLSEPDFLLLDEPSNHLDVNALEWLEEFVRTTQQSVLVVSHDREFLDQTVERILYLDPDTRTIRSYVGNYSDFVEAREHERELHLEAWQKQQEYINKVESDIARLKGQALSVELTTTPRQPHVRRIAKKVARKAISRERKLERYLESDERVERPKNTWSLKLDFGPPPPGGRSVLALEHVYFAYPNASQQPDEMLLQDISFDVQHGERIGIVGPNGMGKTTLLKLISGDLQPNHGIVKIGASIRLGVLSQEHEQLNVKRTLLETVLHEYPMSETEARNFLHFFLFGGDSVFRPIAACSLGERSRLQLALLILRGCNLLLLDEPLNHLDIEGREHFEEALEAFEGTVITVSHDRAFLRSYTERVIAVDQGKAVQFAGGYSDYEEQILHHMHQ
jgi:ATP-binding cassette subfamily F protein 3